MQFSLTPQTLSQMDNVPLQYTGRALDSLDRMGQADSVGLADLQDKFNYDQQNRPQLLQHQDLQNQSLVAQIPGTRATAEMQARKNKEEDLFTPQRIEAMTQKYGADTMAHHVNQLTGMGSLMLAASAEVQNAPIGGTMAARRMFDQAGLGDKWHPEWDKLSTEDLSKKLNSLGQNFVTSGSKAQQLLQTQAERSAMTLSKADQDNRTKLQIAEMNNQRMRDLESYRWQMKTSMNKETLEQYIAHLMRARTNETDPKILAEINSQLAEAQQRKENMATQPGIAPSVGQGGAINLNDKRTPVVPAQGGGLPQGVTKSGW